MCTTLAGLVLALIVSSVVFVAGHFTTAALLRVHGMWPVSRSHPGAPVDRWRLIVLRIAGPTTVYACAAALFALAGALSGNWSAEDTAIIPCEGGPAAAAGMHSGDRVTHVAGVPVDTWDALRREVQRQREAPFELQYTRAGPEYTVRLQWDVVEGIGILPVRHRRAAEVGSVFGQSIAAPILYWQSIFAEPDTAGLWVYLDGRCTTTERDLAGRAPSIVLYLGLFGSMLSGGVPFAVAVMLASLLPRQQGKRA